MKSEIPALPPPSASKSIRLPKTWPHVIRHGDVAVKIYKNKGHVRGLPRLLSGQVELRTN